MKTGNIKKLSFLILGFCIVGIILMVALKNAEIYPFGDNTMIYHDMEYQYMDNLTWLRNVLHGDGRFTYSFSLGMGGGTAAFFAYYLASPFNFLLIFASKENIVLWITIIILSKIMTCFASMFVYLDKRFRVDPFLAMLLSVSYAMIGYNVLQCSNVMWLDGVLVLPLVALGAYRMLNLHKKFLYFFALFYAMLTSYYIGYMICLFMAAYFIFEFIIYCIDNGFEIKDLWLKTKEFILISFLACAGTGVLLLPQTMQMLAQGKVGDNVNMEFAFNCSFLEGWKDLFLNGEKLTWMQANPPIYVGSLPLIFIASFWTDRNADKNRKILTAAALVVLMFFYVCRPAGYIFSLFTEPSNHYYRHAFLYSFMLIAVAGMALSKGGICRDKETGQLQARGILRGMSIVLLSGGIYELILNYSDRELFYRGMICMAIAGIMLALNIYTRHTGKRAVVFFSSIVIVFAICSEFVMNWGQELKDYTYNYGVISAYNSKISKIIEKIEMQDSSTYRIDTMTTRYAGYNTIQCNAEALTFGYSPVSMYTSTQNINTSEMLRDLGYSSTNIITLYTPFPAMDSLLGVKYVLSNSMPSWYIRREELGEPELAVYENPYALSRGYAIDIVSQEENDELDGANPFENQEKFIEQVATGAGEVYTYATALDFETDGYSYNTWQLYVNTDGPLYVYIPDGQVGMQLYVNGNWANGNTWYNNIPYYVGEYSEGDVINITVRDGECTRQQELIAATFNAEVYHDIAMELEDKQVDIIFCSDGEVEAEYDCDADSKLLFTIPYEKGWDIRVNGQKVGYKAYMNGFITFDVPAGSNEISMKYRTPGLKTGMAISLLSFLAFIFIVLRQKIRFNGLKANIPQDS